MSKAEEMPIDARGIKILAHATIKSWIESIVELITNCDDAYKRLENAKKSCSGTIKISISRKKAGEWIFLEVLDEAGGISKKKLGAVTTFFADANEYEKNENIRGFFGRGLKETIVALGIGEIITIQDNKLNVVKIWYDKNKKKTYRHFIIENEEVNNTLREEYKIKKDGTLIRITVENENIKIPELNTIIEQLRNHICIRDILSSKKRKVLLEFQDLKRSIKTKVEVYFEPLKGKEVLKKKVVIPGFKGNAFLKIYENKEQLTFKKYSPFNTAGILIKTKGAILDNQLFKFENDLAAYYFYGELITEEINKILRSGDTSILNPSRSGIEWGHNYSRLLMKSVEKELEPLIEVKRKELSKNKNIEVNEDSKKLFKELSKLFNEIYEEELEGGDIEIDINDVFEEEAFIRPKSPNLPPRKPRTLCFYANENIIKSEGDMAVITAQQNNVYVIDKKIYLEKHKKFPSMFYKKFRVKGLRLGDEDIIESRIGKKIAICDVRVKEMGHKKRGEPRPKKKGNITGFEPNSDSNPMQRSFHNLKTGKIEIFVQFPGVSKYLGESLEQANTEIGKMLLCEIVCEAFFKRIAEERIKAGKEVSFGDSIESHMALYRETVDKLQKKYLNKVYSLVMNWNPEPSILEVSTESNEELDNKLLGKINVLEEEYGCTFCGEHFKNHKKYLKHVKDCSKQNRER